MNSTQEKLLINERRVAYICPQTEVDCATHKKDISTENTLSIMSFSPLYAIKLSLKCTQYDERASRATKLTSAVKLPSASTLNVKLSSLVELSKKKN